jgi:hypothetical protein
LGHWGYHSTTKLKITPIAALIPGPRKKFMKSARVTSHSFDVEYILLYSTNLA